jgi:hypothetical protein
MNSNEPSSVKCSLVKEPSCFFPESFVSKLFESMKLSSARPERLRELIGLRSPPFFLLKPRSALCARSPVNLYYPANNPSNDPPFEEDFFIKEYFSFLPKNFLTVL